MKEISYLSRVTWSPPAPVSQSLTRLGVAHGFLGCPDRGPPAGARLCRQVHGTRVVDGEVEAGTEADALYTRDKGQDRCRVAVKTADCLPVLMVDEDRTIVLAAHAGWRGLTAGILGEAVAAMGRGTLHAVIGPAIGREKFQVGADVVEAVHRLLPSPQAALATSKGTGDRWHVDLAVAAAFALMNAGLAPERIEVMQACTMSSPGVWHSYRREGRGGGSNWSWIKL
jgi:YfiH family protein